VEASAAHLAAALKEASKPKDERARAELDFDVVAGSGAAQCHKVQGAGAGDKSGGHTRRNLEAQSERDRSEEAFADVRVVVVLMFVRYIVVFMFLRQWCVWAGLGGSQDEAL